jgi:hypothetical protein
MAAAKLRTARCHWIVAVHYQPINQSAFPAADAYSVSTGPARNIIWTYIAANVWNALKPLKNVPPRSTDYRPKAQYRRIAAVWLESQLDFRKRRTRPRGSLPHNRSKTWSGR